MLKVGGEVDGLCTRCGMTLAHTIIAMVDGRPVKVECNTCHGVHRFRGDLPGVAGRGSRASAIASAGARATTGAANRSTRPRAPAVSFDEVLRTKELAMSQRYSPRATYSLDQVIEHPSFGLGWVSAVRDANKIEVTFRHEVKVLVHGKR
jgi:hypothetical protein